MLEKNRDGGMAIGLSLDIKKKNKYKVGSSWVRDKQENNLKTYFTTFKVTVEKKWIDWARDRKLGKKHSE